MIFDTFGAEFPLSFCPTGMVPQKSDSPFVPISAEEIVTQVREVADLGITSVHLHARDDQGRPVWEKSYFADIIRGIRETNPELVICVTTSGRIEAAVDRRASVLELSGDDAPDMASLTLSSMNFAEEAFVNSPSTVKALAQRMLDRGIKPELEVFDLGMLNYVKYLVGKGLLEPPFVVNLILGGVASAQATLSDMGALVGNLPPSSVWLAGGIGKAQLPANSLALASGGGVRVGLEDNLYFDSARTHLASNLELVGRVIELAKILGRRPMAPRDFRKDYLAT
jgi:uncharacterized protein (DUF849 family)